MKKILFAVIACAGLAFTSCQLDEYNPKEISGDETLATYMGFYGMQANCYAPLYGQLYTVCDYLWLTEAGTDLWFNAYASNWGQQLMYYQSLVPSANSLWDKAFTQMYSALGTCNTVIQGGASVQDGDAAAVEKLVAEARFLRGFYHLLLTTYYGPITLVLAPPTENPVLAPSRNTLSEIYSSIIADFQAAAEVLGETPFENNRARATKAAARGMMARAYIQGAGQGLQENGVSFYQRAKEVAEAMIADYGTSKMYNDINDMWADANNRNNKEVLFKAAGPDAKTQNDKTNFETNNYHKICNLHKYTFPKLSDIAGIFGTLTWNVEKNYLYGRCNEFHFAPTPYLINLFDASWDMRWENSFTTAFGGYSCPAWSYPTFEKGIITLDAAMCEEYDIDPSHIGKKIYPRYNIGTDVIAQFSSANQYQAYVWPAGTDETTANTANLITPKKAYVVAPSEITETQNQFFLYLSKEPMSAADKAKRAYGVINIADLFKADGTDYKTQDEMLAEGFSKSQSKAAPALNKFNWSYDGVFHGSDLDKKTGDVSIIRMAEIYLIAAEANVALGDGSTAAQHINVLRKRAARAGVSESAWKLTTVDKEGVLDEYARELCGEHSRWAVLQRNGVLKDRLQKYNKRAAGNFQDHCVWRPISLTFLQQIDNADVYGDNGYGITASSGLDGYLQ